MYIFIWMIYIVHFLIQMSIKWARDAKNRLEILKKESVPRSANRQNGERFQLYNINAFKIINMPEKNVGS